MNIVGKRYYFYIISLLFIIPGLISLFIQGLNLGIDFTGGSRLNLLFNKAVTTSAVREVLDDFQLGKSSTIQMSGAKEVLIRTKPLNEDERNKLVAALKDKIGAVTVLSDDKVGPIIGRELTLKAIYALLVASLLMVIYISIRFEFKSGIAAIIALLHDVLVTIGVFSILQIEIDSTFVAAILTIIGYSINDTIIIFDRIRENMRTRPKGESLPETVNRSLLQTMTRSINTVMTVVFTLIALLIFGGETTKVFALALLVGVVSGAYSSIFNASQLWVDFKLAEAGKRAIQARGAR